MIYSGQIIVIMYVLCYTMENISKSSKLENCKGVPQKVIPEI